MALALSAFVRHDITLLCVPLRYGLGAGLSNVAVRLFWNAAGAMAAFVRDNTVHVEGLGDVCSLATFDLARHGNPRYGSPLACPKVCQACTVEAGHGFVCLREASIC